MHLLSARHFAFGGSFDSCVAQIARYELPPTVANWTKAASGDGPSRNRDWPVNPKKRNVPWTMDQKPPSLGVSTRAVRLKKPWILCATQILPKNNWALLGRESYLVLTRRRLDAWSGRPKKERLREPWQDQL
jgi:hypothetical protein